MKINRKGFTLIELLIVIAIIAVLATVVILSLNPAELLRQARDSNRVSDMATMKSAIALYLADVASPSMGTAATCYISVATGTLAVPTSTGAFSAQSSCAFWMLSAPSLVNNSTTRGNDGTGWLPIAFSGISSGAPLGQLPIDPVNQRGTCTGASPSLSSCGLFYAYVASSTNYKLSAKMESTKYANGGGSAVESNDGGNNPYVYEDGTKLSL